MSSLSALPRAAAPPLAAVRQQLRDDAVADVRGETRRRLEDSRLLAQLARGARIAITAGSRGVGGFAELLAGIADALRSAGAEPFLIPAMGSHGGASAAGQIEILRRLGAVRDELPPVRADMATVALGTSRTGACAHVDRIAHEADGIVVLGRVGAHPESESGLASGLLKMLVAGLGKQNGAREAHAHGLWESVREVPRITLARAKIVCGVAVVENAYRRVVAIEVVPPSYDAFLAADLRLVEVARRYTARLPFDDLDLLIVDELGKDVSGTGMDLNVIGRWRVMGGAREPDFRRIAALSLTPASLGNALGIGLADTTTQRLASAYDAAATWVNVLTASEPGAMNTREGKLPFAAESDREAIETALYSALPSARPRVCRIQNTAKLDRFWCSEALLGEVRAQRSLSLESELDSLPYDAAGNLL
jgi:hypothetical protein